MDCTNEMSMAWTSKRFNKCAWVENPSGYANKYFKYLNGSTYSKADKVARISLLKPVYLVHKNTDGKLTWELSNKEKKELVAILNLPTDNLLYNCTNWQALLVQYNYDNFGIQPSDTINNLFSIIEYPDAFDINTPMPNYLELE